MRSSPGGFIFLVIQRSLSRVMKLTVVLKQSSKHRERISKRHHSHEGADGHFPLPTELRKKLVPNFAARLRQEKGPVHPETIFCVLSKVIFGDHSRVSFLRERHHRRHSRRHSLRVWRRGWHRRPFAAEWSLDISSTLDSSLVACLGGHSAASRSFSMCLMSHVLVVTRTQCNYRHNIKHWKQLCNVYNLM